MPMNNTNLIKDSLRDSIFVKDTVLSDDLLIQRVDAAAKAMVDTYKRDGKVLFCGNGGSAADAQHLAAELSGRFFYDRPPLYAEALHVNGSFVTAVANDYSYEMVYQRMVEAAGREGDVLVAISTSGNSAIILNAIAAAKSCGMTVVGFTGETGGKMASLCDILINVPSSITPHIQETHITLGHIICNIVEKTLFPKI
jgi:D-sedoheptulose 7-phosphate isomerase